MESVGESQKPRSVVPVGWIPRRAVASSASSVFVYHFVGLQLKKNLQEAVEEVELEVPSSSVSLQAVFFRLNVLGYDFVTVFRYRCGSLLFLI